MIKDHEKILTREIFSYFNVMNGYKVYCMCFADSVRSVKEIFEKSDIHNPFFIFHLNDISTLTSFVVVNC